MEFDILKDMINVIRKEENLRASQLPDNEPDIAYDQWLFTDGPFVNELCLLILVGLRHRLERVLVNFAARAADNGKDIDSQQYTERVKEIQDGKKINWKIIETRLQCKTCNEWPAIEILRLLANSYKHDPSGAPSKELLKCLELDTNLNYAPLPESQLLQETLATFVGLHANAGYCDISVSFVDSANRFLDNVQKRTVLSQIRLRGLFNANKFLH